MIYFRVGINKCGPTRRSAEAAGFIVTKNTHFGHNDIVLNWGGRAAITGTEKIWNLPHKIANASVKTNALEIIGDMMPQVYDEYSTDIPLPFVGKRNGTRQGRGKRKFMRHDIRTANLVTSYDFLQEWINIEHEYRIIAMWDGKRYINARLFEKVKTPGFSRRPIFHPHWDFKRLRLDDVPEEVRKMAIKAIKKLELQFVGFDIADTNKGFKILEANTAPGLGTESAKKIYRILSEVEYDC